MHRLLRSAVAITAIACVPHRLPAADRPEGIGASVTGFSTIDWIVLATYALVLIGIGAYYSRRQKTTEEYFVASRSLPPFIAGISLYATMFSTLSYIGYPGETIQHGPVVIALVAASSPAIYLIVGYLIIPFIMRLPVTSAYELLEARLGRHVRLLGSGIFIITRLTWMALMLYTTSFVLTTMLGWPQRWITPLTFAIGAVTTTYTLFGGIKAVAVTDVLQFFVLLLGAVVTVSLITVSMGGVHAWWPTHWAAHWAPEPFFSFDPRVRVTILGSFIGEIIWWVCTAGSDQMAVQRYLATRDIAAGRRAFLHNCVASATVVSILGLVGFSVLAFFQAHPDRLPFALTLTSNADALFPHFVSHFLPAGFPGLVVAGMMAAAMSSISSGINSTITVLSKDFMEHLWPASQRTDATRLRTAHYLAAGVGLTMIAGSTVAGLVPGNLVEVSNKTVNLFVCPMFGLFFLALFVPFATPFGAVIGAAYSLAAAATVSYWDVITGGPGISFQWIAPVALVVSLAGGCLFSLLPLRDKPLAVQAASAAVLMLPWALLFVVLT